MTLKQSLARRAGRWALVSIVLAGCAGKPKPHVTPPPPPSLSSPSTPSPSPSSPSTSTPAAIACPGMVPTNEELKEPRVLTADPQTHVLSTTFSLQMKMQCVPVGQFKNGKLTGWGYEPLSLRTYVYPDPDTGQPTYGFPGPTLKIRKQAEERAPQRGVHGPITPGDRLKILLVNELPASPGAHNQCDNACAADYTCPADKKDWPEPTTCLGTVKTGCCCWVNENNHWPDCFHGDNDTNLHFHGTHVSPQSPQDYVLLELRPKAAEGQSAAGAHGAHARGVVQYGSFQYDVDPPPPTQAEGTHWYHPHKHGSVSLQVANGLPGALIIEGPFDDWLRGYYAQKGSKLTEKVIVVQQIQQNTNLYVDSNAPPLTANGQVSPKITMRPGEVQRWRFINATMNVAAQFMVMFPPGATVRQIAQDGVRFAPGTYAQQPLFSSSDPSVFVFSPGNRADFLVQAPMVPGRYRIVHRPAGAPGEFSKQRIARRDRALRALEVGADQAGPPAGDASAEAIAAASPALITLVVEAPGSAPAVATALPTPAEWPKMPWYLENLTDQSAQQHNLDFQMVASQGSPVGNPTTQFLISGVQYDDQCVNVTTKLNETDQWVVENSSSLEHPFHIHTNPFQLVEQGSVINGKRTPFIKYDPPVWRDTIALPKQGATWDVPVGAPLSQADAATKCPRVCSAVQATWSKKSTPGGSSFCGCVVNNNTDGTMANGYVLFRHRYLEFTGEYVLHCHFLGHEDRGMMWSVQTVCPEDPKNFGAPKPYPTPECTPNVMRPAGPACSPSATGKALQPAPGGARQGR